MLVLEERSFYPYYDYPCTCGSGQQPRASCYTFNPKGLTIRKHGLGLIATRLAPKGLWVTKAQPKIDHYAFSSQGAEGFTT